MKNDEKDDLELIKSVALSDYGQNNFWKSPPEKIFYKMKVKNGLIELFDLVLGNELAYYHDAGGHHGPISLIHGPYKKEYEFVGKIGSLKPGLIYDCGKKIPALLVDLKEFYEKIDGHAINNWPAIDCYENQLVSHGLVKLMGNNVFNSINAFTSSIDLVNGLEVGTKPLPILKTASSKVLKHYVYHPQSDKYTIKFDGFHYDKHLNGKTIEKLVDIAFK